MTAIVTLAIAVLILRRLLRDAPRVVVPEPEFLAVRPKVKVKAKRAR